MKTLTVGESGIPKPAVTHHLTIQKALLACGILAPVVYIAANILGAMVWKGYSLITQSVSELSAINAPSRPLLIPMMLTFSVLMVAFGVGVWQSAGEKRSLRITAVLLIGYGLFCLTGPFFPMHLRGVEKTLTDTLHIINAMVDSLFIFLFIGFGANAFGKWFRLYSIGTIVLLLVLGAWTSTDGPRIAANLPTPWIGVSERILIFSSLLWTAVFAVLLLRAQIGRLGQKKDRSEGPQ